MPKKELKVLEELIRNVTNNILTKEERIGYIINPELKKRLYGKNPECFICLKRLGRDTSDYLMPICNRLGIIDPLAIQISYKVIGRILSDVNGIFDINDLNIALDKLDSLKNKYNKNVPKPPVPAQRKAMVTRMFNNIKGHLQIISPKK